MPRISTPLVLVFVLLSVVDSVLVLVFEDNESINVDLTIDSTCSPRIHFDSFEKTERVPRYICTCTMIQCVAGSALQTLVKAGSYSSS